MSKPFNPHAEMTAYKKTVEDRGYDAFSNESLTAWHNEFGHMTPSDVHGVAEFNAKSFMTKVNTPGAYGHQSSRARFKDEFDGDEKAVRDHFRNEANLENGLKYHGNHGLHRDLSYEKRMSSTGQTVNSAGIAEAQTLKDLMTARFAAQGYTEHPGQPDNDSDYRDRFFDEYCIGLKNPKKVSNGAGAIYGPDGPSKAATDMENMMSKIHEGVK